MARIFYVDVVIWFSLFHYYDFSASINKNKNLGYRKHFYNQLLFSTHEVRLIIKYRQYSINHCNGERKLY